MLDRLSLPLRIALEDGLRWLDGLTFDQQKAITEPLVDVLREGVHGHSPPEEVGERLRMAGTALLMRRAYEDRAARLRTAYHEAGHAVVACAVGIPFMRVTVVPDDVASLGHVLFDTKELRPVRSLAHADSIVVMELAGPEAERFGAFGPSENTLTPHLLYADDVLALAAEMADWSIEARGRRRVMLHQRATDLLAVNRRWVERVATTLMKNDRLTQEEVWALSAEPLTLAA